MSDRYGFLTSGGGGGADDQTAAEVPFTPTGALTATDTQTAVAQAAALTGGGSRQYPHLVDADDGVSDEIQAGFDASAFAVGDVISTAAYYEGSQYGGCTYRVVASATGTDDGGSYIDFTGFQLEAVFGRAVPAAAFGLSPAATGVENAGSLQAAVDFVEAADGGRVEVGPGNFALGATVDFADTVELVGAGKYVTRFELASSVTGFSVEGQSLGARNFNTTSLGAYNMGARFAHFLMHGENGQNQRGFRFLGGTDHLRVDNVAFFHLDQAIKIAETGGVESAGTGANVRESGFWDVTLNLCGSATLAALEITQPDGSTGDGTNQLSFHRLEVVYSRGVSILIENLSTSEFIRRVDFQKLMLHGIDGAATPAAADLMVLKGNVNDVKVYGLAANSSETGFACVRLAANGVGSVNWPRNVHIEGSLLNCAGDGIVVEAVQGLKMDIAAAGVVTGDTVRIDANASRGGRPIRLDLDSNAETSANEATVTIDAGQLEYVRGYWNGDIAPAPHVETASGDASTTAFAVNHGLDTSTPDNPTVIVDGVIVADGWSATIVDADNLTVNFDVAPATGTDNITIKVSA